MTFLYRLISKFLKLILIPRGLWIVPSTWRELQPLGAKPAARWQHRAAYDTASNRMIAVGGKTNESGPDLNFNDVWLLHNADEVGGAPSWVQSAPSGTPPIARHNHTIVYDATNERVILFGGHVDSGGPFSHDVWVLKHAIDSGTASWTELNPTGTPPGDREWHSAIYDSVSNRMVVFGGQTLVAENTIWVLEHANGLGGPSSWLKIDPVGPAPGPRVGHTAVYDAANNRMIVFGGHLRSGAYTADVWVLRYANGLGGTPEWTELNPSGAAPALRMDHTAVYDATQNRMVVFGGWISSGGGVGTYFNDVWVLHNANGLSGAAAWKPLTPTSSPPEKRELHSAIYNPLTKRMVVFGGAVTPQSMRNDLWLLTQATGP